MPVEDEFINNFLDKTNTKQFKKGIAKTALPEAGKFRQSIAASLGSLPGSQLRTKQLHQLSSVAAGVAASAAPTEGSRNFATSLQKGAESSLIRQALENPELGGTSLGISPEAQFAIEQVRRDQQSLQQNQDKINQDQSQHEDTLGLRQEELQLREEDLDFRQQLAGLNKSAAMAAEEAKNLEESEKRIASAHKEVRTIMDKFDGTDPLASPPNPTAIRTRLMRELRLTQQEADRVINEVFGEENKLGSSEEAPSTQEDTPVTEDVTPLISRGVALGFPEDALRSVNPDKLESFIEAEEAKTIERNRAQTAQDPLAGLRRTITSPKAPQLGANQRDEQFFLNAADKFVRTFVDTRLKGLSPAERAKVLGENDIKF